MDYKFKKFILNSKNIISKDIKLYFQPLKKYPKTIVGVSIILTGIMFAYGGNIKVLNNENSNSFGLEKIIENSLINKN